MRSRTFEAVRLVAIVAVALACLVVLVELGTVVAEAAVAVGTAGLAAATFIANRDAQRREHRERARQLAIEAYKLTWRVRFAGRELRWLLEHDDTAVEHAERHGVHEVDVAAARRFAWREFGERWSRLREEFFSSVDLACGDLDPVLTTDFSVRLQSAIAVARRATSQDVAIAALDSVAFELETLMAAMARAHGLRTIVVDVLRPQLVPGRSGFRGPLATGGEPHARSDDPSDRSGAVEAVDL